MLSIIFVIIAGIFNAISDILQFKYSTSFFSKLKNRQFVDPSISWKNKWKSKYDFIDKIMSTILVMFTDLWHLSKFLMIICFTIAIVFYIPLYIWYIDIFIFYLLFTTTFELFFSFVLIKRK